MAKVMRADKRVATRVLDPHELRTRVADALEKASTRMIRRLAPAGVDLHLATDEDELVRALQARVSALGQLAAGLAIVDAGCLPARGAGFGSRVRMQDLDTNEIADYMLMVGSLVDIDADQVSLASPIGQALIGREPGDVITFVTPQRRVRMRVLELNSILETLEEQELAGETR